jgi:hypothetical protein
MSDNPDGNRKNEKFCLQLSTLKDTWDLGRQMSHSEGLEQEDLQTMLRAAGETETTQENIRDWLELDGDPGFQLSDRGRNCCRCY